MKTCPSCQRQQADLNRYCIGCGRQFEGMPPTSLTQAEATPEALNLQVLYGMVAVLMLAVLFPPWETPPSQPPDFLGMHFILTPPTPDAVVSRLLLTIELVTIAIAGLYASFLFRKR
jgi:hypothetical protein